MTCQLELVEETRVPGENNRLTQTHWQLSHMPFGIDDDDDDDDDDDSDEDYDDVDCDNEKGDLAVSLKAGYAVGDIDDNDDEENGYDRNADVDDNDNY